MSASPSANAAPSTKRPLEEEPSASGQTDQPDAKRPALDKTADGEPAKAEAAATSEKPEESKPLQNGHSLPSADAVVADGSATANPLADLPEPQPIQSTTAQQDRSRASDSAQPQAHQDESSWIHIRAVISSAEAATVIGKGGENVSQVRRLSGAKCTVSDYTRGAVERIMTVSGGVDASAKAFGLMIRTLNNEPLESPSTPQSKTYPLRLLVPHILIGSIIGKGGVRIREIQDASGARLNASDACLPLSTERSLVVLGVADAVHIATYYIGQTLVEQLTERFGGPAASAYATRSGGPAGVVPGGMQVVPYMPQPAGGQFGHPSTYKRHENSASRTPANPYGIPYLHGQGSPAGPAAGAAQPLGGAANPYGAPQQAQAHLAYGGGVPAAAAHGQPQHAGQPQAHHPAQGGAAGPGGQPMPAQAGMPGQPLTQQIFIPNDMVGAIIGKGGAKINEIRQLSGSVIKINEPQDNSNERLVTITGTQECNQMALYMLYQRLESEKHRI